MAGDFVTAAGDLAQQVGVPLGPPAHDEKRGVLLVVGEGVEDGRARLEAGPDVEDEGQIGQVRIAANHRFLGDRHARLLGVDNAARDGERKHQEQREEQTAHALPASVRKAKRGLGIVDAGTFEAYDTDISAIYR